MKRAVGWLVGLYLVAAVAGLVRERAGRISCGCAEDCWCHRPGLSFFRWVFPWRHRSAHDAPEDVA